MSFPVDNTLAWYHLPDTSIFISSPCYDSFMLCSANPGAEPRSPDYHLPGQALLPRETAQLLHVHATQAQAHLQLYAVGPCLMYQLVADQPWIPYEHGYLDNIAQEIRELRDKVWREKETQCEERPVVFNQRPIHPRKETLEVRDMKEPQDQSDSPDSKLSNEGSSVR